MFVVVVCVVFVYSCSKIDPTGIYSCVCNYELNGTNYVNDTQATFPRQSKEVSQAECIDDGADLTSAGAKEVACTTK